VTSTLKEGVDPTLGWEKIVRGKLETHVVAGAHGECINYPGVTQLAEILTNAML
jgi:hypothetical protein